ncbi:helical backbone metal receptor [Lentibacillus saliphilus]|uniref:helical backbone metal receptor n=1 Tax=Lentibacillus saliphilus TaxID=2737028 RepID=UPI001C309846|nr:helical backbone metal receptor [Lentibacillus saliphilus]
MKSIVDHLNRPIQYTYPPQRIVSLCPAITETMFHIGLGDSIVGRTRFCKYPEEDDVKHVTNIGGTKDIKLERIKSLQPDLIIAEKEENTKEIVDTLAAHFPVFVFEIQTVNDAYRMIQDLGMITNHQTAADQLVQTIKAEFRSLPQTNGYRVAYMIWQDPYMVVGKETYIQSMLNNMGFVNPFTTLHSRYPIVTEQDLKSAALDYVFLATEPFPFRDQHLDAFRRILPNVTPIIVDGEMLWYGAKMLQAVQYFKKHLRTLND